VFDTLGVLQKRARQNGVKNLALNYTWTGGKQCKTVPSGFYVLWSGPYPDAKTARQLCNRLGWKKADDPCFGRAIDEGYKGKQHIRPDGTYD
jgi:hypothetical protein